MQKKTISSVLLTLILSGCGGVTSTDTQKLQPQAHNQTLDITDSRGHFLATNLFFYYGQLQTGDRVNVLSGLDFNASYRLTPTELSAEQRQKFVHLAGKGSAFTLAEPMSIKQQKQLLKGPLLLQISDLNGVVKSITRVQTGFAIDALFTAGDADADEVNDLGSVLNATGTQFKLWAPTARNVNVLLFDQQKQPISPSSLAMQFDAHTGVWVAQIDQHLNQVFYQYQIEVYHPESQSVQTLITTDPYSLSLSTNSEYSQVVDLNNDVSKPLGWDEQENPTVNHPEDNVFYELHIGDFSASDSALSNEAVRGKYAAFEQTNSDGIQHLKQLKSAGLNNVHLLPTFDIGTVNEDPEQRVTLNDSLAKLCRLKVTLSICANDSLDKSQSIAALLTSFDVNSSDAQALVSEMRTLDNYNWGYDPFHYTVPEGSYAQNPDGVSRIKEFRSMVMALHNMGFRVIMDVVYNHTHQAGLEATSVLDKIVPGYYQRLNPITAMVEQSTCCDNTATERKMMAKLMQDSLVVWARDYKIDGFRFDLMAHQPKDVMLAARDAVSAVDADTYFYGEGWNFGEVANNQRFEQASQLNLAGSEIGTFTDRLRDAVRGGGMTASGEQIRQQQGIGNGLFTRPNELRSKQDSKQQYLLFADQLRVGLAANLATYPLRDRHDEQVTGADVPYGDQPAGYALDPADTINYVSKHDNQTLWDNHQYRIAFDVSTDDRVRMQALSLAYPMYAQGIPFIHMGSELLRSKSYLRDSYDYGDWFNAVDFGMQDNNYHVGLPPAEKDRQNWQIISKIIDANQGRDQVQAKHIQFMSDRFAELLKIRMSSPLFRLTSAAQIESQLRFLNTGSKQVPGLIVMQLTDRRDIDPNYQQITVLFNSSADAIEFDYSDAQQYQLHPVLAKSSDPITQQHRVTNKGFVVQKFSAAVFVRR
ncbi:pullulanase-type alpha-1,6-glucosidase [Thalassotalea ponticola]|uniref:pullulanase-type alpha-1,6-glucosidase n=1 Tax=Thalassotalea ponticola TaxID=1523392 RepID=UPI0025B59FB3|nr:pullulanase-type alpha-1,6-glucosidase [Thalassotalea ponticola]MDN3652493.1 pullulanase-type alpha-1,6-glucosidase [Thalassotalea ponticola]